MYLQRQRETCRYDLLLPTSSLLHLPKRINKLSPYYSPSNSSSSFPSSNNANHSLFHRSIPWRLLPSNPQLGILNLSFHEQRRQKWRNSRHRNSLPTPPLLAHTLYYETTSWKETSIPNSQSINPSFSNTQVPSSF